MQPALFWYQSWKVILSCRKKKQSNVINKGYPNENHPLCGCASFFIINISCYTIKPILYKAKKLFLFSVVGIEVHLLNLAHERITWVCACALVIECFFNHNIKFSKECFFFDIIVFDTGFDADIGF